MKKTSRKKKTTTTKKPPLIDSVFPDKPEKEKPSKFPERIYVVIENEGSDGEFLEVLNDADEDESVDATRSCAVYRLDDVGKVEVARKFISGGKRG